jgi:hypothetical protein
MKNSRPAWPHGRGGDAGMTGPSLSPDQPDHPGGRTESVTQNKIHIASVISKIINIYAQINICKDI